MPRTKSLNADPVAAFVMASQQFAQAKAKLQEAVLKNVLTHEQQAYYDLLKDGFMPKKGSRPKREKGPVFEADAFEADANENGAETASTVYPHKS